MKLLKLLREITIKPPTPKFIILKKSKEGETFLDVDWSGVEKYCITLIPNIDENYIADIVMGWDHQNQDFQAYPEKIDEYNLSLYNYVNYRLKLYREKYIKEITIKSPHPLEKLKLLKPGTKVESRFKIGNRNYNNSGIIEHIGDMNRDSIFIIVKSSLDRTYYLDIPSTKESYDIAKKQTLNNDWLGKLPFGTLFLDNLKIISQPEEEINEIQFPAPSHLNSILLLIKFLKEKNNRFNGLSRNISNILLSAYFKNSIDIGKGNLKDLPESELIEIHKKLLLLKQWWEREPDEDYTNDNRDQYLAEIEIKDGGPGFITAPKPSANNTFGNINAAVFKIDYNKILEWCRKTNRNDDINYIKNIIIRWKENQLKGKRMSPKDIAKYDKWLYTFLSVVLPSHTKKIDEIEIKPKINLNFDDENLYEAVYNGKSEEINEFVSPHTYVHIYNLGYYVTFRPTGNLEYKTFLMPKKYFKNIKKDNYGTLHSWQQELAWIKKATDNKIYKVIK